MRYAILLLLLLRLGVAEAQVRGLFRVSGSVSGTVTTPPSGTVVSGTPGSVTVTITFDGLPTNFMVLFADMKNDAGVAMIPVKDDGGIGDVNAVHPVVSTFAQDDGTGYKEPWHYTFPGNSVGTGRDGSNPTQTSWAQMRTLRDTKRYWWSNHSWDHANYYDRLYEVRENARQYYNQLGIRLTDFTIPVDYEGYVETAFSQGYRMVASQGYGQSRYATDGNSANVLNFETVTADKMLLATPPRLITTRWYIDDFTNPSLVSSMQNWWNTRIASYPGTTPATKAMLQWFSHGPKVPVTGANIGDTTEVHAFRQMCQFLNTTLPPGKRMWVAGMGEWEQYYRVMKQTVKTQVVSGNTVILYLDQSAVDKDVRDFGMSLLVSGGTITNVSIQGADNNSTWKGDYNGTTGLINIRKMKMNGFADPSLDPAPPQITSATVYGSDPNSVYVTFDSTITQSKPVAYKVHSSTLTGYNSFTATQNVTSLSAISGTIWKLTTSTPISSTGQVLDYRMQSGDASRLGGSGKKVLSYIGLPITISTGSEPTGRVSGTIPFNSEWLWQDNAPVTPIDTLFTASAPASGNWPQAYTTYGQLTSIYDNYLNYPDEVSPAINQVDYALAYGGYTGREMQVYSTDKTTGVEELMWTFSQSDPRNQNISQTLSKTYYPKRLRIRSINNGVPVYFRPKGTYLPYNQPTYPITKYPFVNQTGVNMFTWDLLQNQNISNGRNKVPAVIDTLINSIGGVRLYLDNDDLTHDSLTYHMAVTWKGFALDSALTRLKQMGKFYFLDLKEMTQDMKYSYPDSSKLNSERLPIYYGANKKVLNSFRRAGQIAFQVGATWGNNKTISRSLIRHNETIGRNLCTYFSFYNEADKYWKEYSTSVAPSYADGETLAIMMSVIYDGHMGTMGPDVGLKTADPTLKLHPPGLATVRPDIFRRAKEWVIANRGYKQDGSINWPWDDHLEIHAYLSTAGLEQYASNGSTAPRGIVPELSQEPKALNYFNQVNYPQLGNKKLIIGEFGYNLGQNTKYSSIVPAGSSLSVEQWNGAQYLRGANQHAKLGVFATTVYQWEDDVDPAQTGNWNGTVYGSMGLIKKSGTYPNITILPRSNLAYMAQFNKFMGGHIHAQTVSSSPVLVDRYTRSGQGDVYFIVSPTESNLSGTYTLSVPVGTTSATLYTVRENVLTPLTTPLTITNNTVSVPYSEVPVGVKIN